MISGGSRPDHKVSVKQEHKQRKWEDVMADAELSLACDPIVSHNLT